MPLGLLLPGLVDVDAAALAACAPLARLAAHARGEAVDDADAALLQAAGVDAAVAPLAAAGAGLADGSAWVARADPVTTLLTHDDVRVVARVDDLDAGEAAALATLLDAHFAADGLRFVAPRADAWFVLADRPHAVAFTPLSAATSRPLRARLPVGDDARRWRRWWTEVQMLLHAHPLGARPRHPVGTLWFSAAGRPAARLAPVRAFAGPGRDADAARGLARQSGGDVHPPDALAAALGAGPPGPALAVAPPVVDAASLHHCAEALVVPALDALDAGRLDALVLVGSGRADAARWQVRRASWAGRLLRRRAPFVLPDFVRE